MQTVKRITPVAAGVAVALTAACFGPQAAAHEAHKHRAAKPTESVAAVKLPAAKPLPFDMGGPFSLVDHNGRRRTDRDFLGSYILIFFGYANCKSMCPVGLGRMVKALDILGAAAARIQPLFVSVDPESDTAPRLRDFVTTLHPRMIGLTGTPAEVRGAAKVYNVQYEQVTPASDPDRIFSHGSYVYLMKPDGRFATLLPPILGAEAMAKTIRRYLR